MLIALARALVRVLSFLLIVLLALLGLGAAVFCIQSGTETLSLPRGAELIGLPQARDWVGGVLDGLEAPGPAALVGLASGLGAMLLGGLLLAGLLVPRRERLVVLDRTDEGTVAARRRALARAATVLAEQTGGVTQARVRVRPRRRAGGVVRVRADRPRTADAKEVERAVKERLAALTEPFKLKTAVSSRLGRRGARVE